jgi:hypothetical protein
MVNIRNIILNEIELTTKKDDYNWRYVQSDKPKKGDKYVKKHIFTFIVPPRKGTKNVKGKVRDVTFSPIKYMVHSEEYENNFYLVSFFPKLNKDFYVKQAKLQSRGHAYDDEYTHRVNEKLAFKVLGIMVDYMNEVIELNPKASFGYYGAPDKKNDEDNDLFNTQRVRIYNEMLNDQFGTTHKLRTKTEFSGSLLLNKVELEANPALEDYGMYILRSHL